MTALAPTPMAIDTAPITPYDDGSNNNFAVNMEGLYSLILALKSENQIIKAQVGGILAGSARHQVKAYAPSTFDGSRGNVDLFIAQMRAYQTQHMDLNGSSTAERVLYAASFLEGGARSWFEPSLRDFLENESQDRQVTTSQIFSSYQGFEKALYEAFGSQSDDSSVEKQPTGLRQMRSVSQYATDFCRMASMQSWDADTAISHFKNGLKTQVKDSLAGKEHPGDLNAYIDLAIKMDNHLKRRRKKKSNARGASNRSRSPGNGMESTSSVTSASEKPPTAPRSSRRASRRRRSTGRKSSTAGSEGSRSPRQVERSRSPRQTEGSRSPGQTERIPRETDLQSSTEQAPATDLFAENVAAVLTHTDWADEVESEELAKEASKAAVNEVQNADADGDVDVIKD